VGVLASADRVDKRPDVLTLDLDGPHLPRAGSTRDLRMFCGDERRGRQGLLAPRGTCPPCRRRVAPSLRRRCSSAAPCACPTVRLGPTVRAAPSQGAASRARGRANRLSGEGDRDLTTPGCGSAGTSLRRPSARFVPGAGCSGRRAASAHHLMHTPCEPELLLRRPVQSLG